jgi:non-specific serine/threonine protein kinase
VSVFAGGWTIASAERVCGGHGIASGDVLHLLSSLVDKNLVVAEARSENTRFGMLETVRDYAQQHLRDSGDSAAVRDSLTDYLTDLAARLDADQDDVLQNTLRRFDAEHDNLRVALAWCESDPARSLNGLRLAALLVEFWRVRGLYGEGLAWLRRLHVTVPAVEHGEIRAMALHASGTLLGVDSDQAAAAARLREAVVLWRQLGDPRQTARSLVCLTEVEWYGGNAESAHVSCAEALSISRELGDWRNVVDALLYSAEMARVAGDYDAAQGLLDECLPVSRGIGGWATAATLNYLAMLEYDRGDYARARSTWRKALPGYREFGDSQGGCATLMSIAMVALELGDVNEATSCLREAWDWLPGSNDNELLYWLDAFASLLVARSSAADAARVWGCTERHREERGLERPYSKRYLRMLDAAHSALQDEAAFDRAWREGRAWPLDEARQFARAFYEGRLHQAPVDADASHDTLVARE